ncbi:MAG: bifunctional alpha/beta hydrolase/class I SAM-dependent methyltransferase [Alphaproteobacteria bacterium]|nr:bifunctional alpha/beta hydrolase/class I SAM-dependent methyltransferase [Alphaproteobacteria bacterium]
MEPRSADARSFTTHDGEILYYRRWPSRLPSPRGAIVLLHRGHEHSGRLIPLVHELDLPDFAIYAWDARGHGRSAGPRGFSPGAATSVRDVQTFVDHICAIHGHAIEDVVVIGQSVGAVLAAAWAHDYAPNIAGLVLAASAFKVKLYLPFARPLLRLVRRVRGDFFINSYVRPKLLTHDRERVAAFKADPLITRAISVNMLLGLHDLSQRVIEDAAAITVPTQLLISDMDWVVHTGPQHHFFGRLGAAKKERHVFAGFYHDTLGEKERKLAVDEARRFILERFETPVVRPCLLAADKAGFTRAEVDRLAIPLPAWSRRGLYWRAMRFGLNTWGRLSKGIRTGHRTGFDSGTMLDYVYRNRPQGWTPLGRALDRSFLNSIGWRGIRQRKVHIEQLLGEAIGRVHADGAPVHVMDIAAGHGRYVLDAIEASDPRPQSILLRDYSDLNVAEGSDLIAQKGLSDVARFVKGDAFDGPDLAAVEPRPTIAIVSGLYELFADNGLVRASLDGLAAAIPEGGYLIYTCQPWHPQIELIARALTSHRQGQAWVMRRRSQVEMDQLVAAAGFKKIDQRVDEWGIFTVALARRQSDTVP